MSNRQTLESITSEVLLGVGSVLDKYPADGIVVHGDTSTTMAATLAAFYRKIPVFHVEAGLRTHDIYSPWPEEANRRITDCLSSLYFAPTASAKDNLLAEHVEPEKIQVTGNTVIDALIYISSLIEKDRNIQNRMNALFSMLDLTKKMVLITGHRRENFGEPFRHFCSAIKTLATNFPDIQFVYPVHLNPNVRKPVNEILENRQNIFLLEPLEYMSFVYLMQRSYLIITDSGGIQEEAPSFSVPVLITREKTERPEALLAGTAKLVGTNQDTIVSEASRLLSNRAAYEEMQSAKNPFGDGHASRRIAQSVFEYVDPEIQHINQPLYQAVEVESAVPVRSI